MEVRAIRRGFHNGHMVYPGEVFEVSDGLKGKWFIPADAPIPTEPSKPKADEPLTLSELGKARAGRPPVSKPDASTRPSDQSVI